MRWLLINGNIRTRKNKNTEDNTATIKPMITETDDVNTYPVPGSKYPKPIKGSMCVKSWDCRRYSDIFTIMHYAIIV